MTSAQRLTAAAEELVKAAYLDIKEDGENKVVKETVSAIQVGNDHLVAMKTSMDAKINTLNQNVEIVEKQLAGLNKTMAAQTKTIADQAKMQSLCWAIDNCTTNEFTYYYKPSNQGIRRENSGAIVRQILFSFRRGYGHFLPEKACLTQSHYNQSQEEKTKAENDFRVKLVNCIHDLTGQKPRTGKEGERAVIYYS